MAGRRGEKMVLMAAALLLLAGAPAETLTLREIRQINEDGFGSPANKYAFSMAVYKDALYVGTLNIRHMAGMFNFLTSIRTSGWSRGAEVWRYDQRGSWTCVVSGGLGRADNIGVRKMAVINECLYGVTANHNEGMEVWRTCDGTEWEVVARAGFGDKRNTSGRGLGFFRGFIYVGTENRLAGAQLWRSADGKRWERVADKGIQDADNIWLSDFAEFKGRLYLGTLNLSGCQLFRTRDGLHFERVAHSGFEKKTNVGAMKLIVFKDRLFVSTSDFSEGFDLYVSEDGLLFQRVLERGFTAPQNAYLWQMQEFNGRLYAGTYHHLLPLPRGRFSLFSSADGLRWEVEDETGFGEEWFYGLRSMAVFQNQLILGTASARFGTKVFAAHGR